MKKIRIAQIGINRYSHGCDIFLTLKTLPEIFEIAGYALVEDERESCADKLWVFEGYRELSVEEILDDPTIDAVAVETDEIHLTKYALMAAKKGKHIHMEKPGSQSLTDFETLIACMKKSGKVFHIGYMYRYNPYISEAVRRVKSGELGEVYSVEAHMSRKDNEVTRRWLKSFKGGMMFYLGCHLIDLVLRIQGLPEKVIPLNCSVEPELIDSQDFAMAVLQYKNGVSFVKTCAVENGGFERRQLVICGIRGSIEIKPLEEYVKTDDGINYPFITAKKETDADGKAQSSISQPFDRYKNMLLAFGEMVRNEKENPYTYDYEMELFRIISECCEA